MCCGSAARAGGAGAPGRAPRRRACLAPRPRARTAAGGTAATSRCAPACCCCRPRRPRRKRRCRRRRCLTARGPARRPSAAPAGAAARPAAGSTCATCCRAPARRGRPSWLLRCCSRPDCAGNNMFICKCVMALRSGTLLTFVHGAKGCMSGCLSQAVGGCVPLWRSVECQHAAGHGHWAGSTRQRRQRCVQQRREPSQPGQPHRVLSTTWCTGR